MSIRMDKNGHGDQEVVVEKPRNANRRGPHLPTVVWGLVLVAVPVLAVLREVTDVRIDLGLLVPLTMVALGGLLLVAALLTLVRTRSSDDAPTPAPVPAPVPAPTPAPTEHRPPPS